MSEVTTLDELVTEIFEELSVELTATDPQYTTDFENVLKNKVKQGVRKVKGARNYPDTDYYTEEIIATDLYNNYYANCRDLALFYYNTIGAEFETSHNENDLSRDWKDETSLLVGVIPISRQY